MSIQLDARQTEYRGILQRIYPYLSLPALDQIVKSINSELQPPLSVDASNPASLVINVGPSTVANSVSSRNKSANFINNVVPSFSGGTVTFPASSGGNITCSTGFSTTLTIASNQYVSALIYLDSSSNLGVSLGSSASTAAGATVPSPTTNTLPFAFVTLHNLSGTIQNVTQANITELVGGGGPGGGSSGNINFRSNEVSIGSGATSVTVTFTSNFSDTNYYAGGMIYNSADTNPQFQPVDITNKTVSGFTAKWNAPTNSANYKLDYLATAYGSGSTPIPSAGTLNVTGGGTGVATLSPYDVVVGGTTSTGPVQQVSGEGIAGQVLTSNGPSTLPSWQNSSGLPPGSVTAFAGVSAPSGFLICDGSAISRSTYSSLFSTIGTAYGAGNGTTTFNIPDLRGRFLRGVDAGSGNDPDASSRTASNSGGNTGNNVGSLQSDAFASHNHDILPQTSVAVSAGYAGYSNQVGGNSQTGSTGGNETRPKNVYVNYIIKY